MSRRWSLRRRLVGSVLAVVAGALGTLALLLYLSLRETLWERSDENLGEEARAVAARVEEGPGGWELEDGEGSSEAAEGLWYTLRADDGRMLDGSMGVPGPVDLDGLQIGTPVTRPLPGGARTRVLRLSLSPRLDDAVTRPSGRKLEVTVAHPTAQLETTLATLRAQLAGATGLVSVAAALLVGWVVTRSVRRVETLGREIDRIDASGLERRLSAAELPLELEPAANKVNELLGRIQASFDHERRFSQDVAHELRTPLAGILATTEVALSRHRSVGEYRQSLEATHQIGQQMGAVVESLLQLARAEAGTLSSRNEPVDLRELVDRTYAQLEAEAARRRLRFTNHIASGTEVLSDPLALR
ncbi:MAG TPA: histidine kinase dimerization/phospho-acceptor domain-containing protein, partial [Myxococcaceae bacterium]|nr:histidine kinase dimerization/phospho-acceptor domain-containing protein [Myxococcaceae bacterium]